MGKGILVYILEKIHSRKKLTFLVSGLYLLMLLFVVKVHLLVNIFFISFFFLYFWSKYFFLKKGTTVVFFRDGFYEGGTVKSSKLWFRKPQYPYKVFKEEEVIKGEVVTTFRNKITKKIFIKYKIIPSRIIEAFRWADGLNHRHSMNITSSVEDSLSEAAKMAHLFGENASDFEKAITPHIKGSGICLEKIFLSLNNFKKR